MQRTPFGRQSLARVGRLCVRSQRPPVRSPDVAPFPPDIARFARAFDFVALHTVPVNSLYNTYTHIRVVLIRVPAPIARSATRAASMLRATRAAGMLAAAGPSEGRRGPKKMRCMREYFVCVPEDNLTGCV